MVQEIHKYKAKDGSEWNTVEEAEKREVIVDAASDFIKPLGEKPKDPKCEFANGKGFIQHDKYIVAQMKMNFIKFCAVTLKKPELLRDKCSFNFIGRYLDDSDSPPYYIWSRLMCIDDHGREFGQAYYANNPQEATYIKLR